MAIPQIEDYELTQVTVLAGHKVTWQLEANRAVLLIHDMQNYFVDFYERDGELMQMLLRNIRALKIWCRQAGIPVLYTAQPCAQSARDRALLNDFWGPGPGDDKWLEEIVRELAPDDGDIRYIKWRYSAFQRTQLHEYLLHQRRDQLIVCGIYAHIGVLATALEAFMKDVQAFVVSDAVADFSADKQVLALEYIAQCCGKVVPLAEVNAILNATDGGIALSLKSIRQDVADSLMLPLSEIGETDNLMDLGLDSIRLMALVEKWRAQGADIHFVDLAEAATLFEWWAMIKPPVAGHTLARDASHA